MDQTTVDAIVAELVAQRDFATQRAINAAVELATIKAKLHADGMEHAQGVGSPLPKGNGQAVAVPPLPE